MSGKKKILTIEMKKYVFATLFVFVWLMTFLADKSSWWLIWIYLQEWLLFLFWEYYKFIFAPVILLISLFLIKEKSYNFDLYRLTWLIFFFTSISTLLWSTIKYQAFFNLNPLLEKWLWLWVIILSITFFILSLIILFQFSPVIFTQKVISTANWIKNNIKNDATKLAWDIKKTKNEINTSKQEKKKQEIEDLMVKLKKEKETLAKEKQAKQLNLWDAPKKIIIEKKENWILTNIFWKKDDLIKIEKIEWNQVEKIKNINSTDFPNWVFPSIELLNERWSQVTYDKNEIRRKEIEIEEKLLQFKIEVTMEWYQVWPTVIQYRLKPKSWVKLQKIVNLKDDLTLALKAKSIRIQAPIPGLWVVWIEIPNSNRQTIWLKELLKSPAFLSKKNEIPIAIWKDVSWELIIWDLAKMPHLLVAWQTWSWKSVWMNWFLISMLYKFTPSELKLIMVDPKRVELSVYNWIPHLLTPVITSPEKALNALKWCVAEMIRRYDLATQVKARNFLEYNEKVWKKDKFPYIVMVIDELADLMLSWNKKEVETSIARVAQMARAVWIHLIIATQRPSVDVITWLIKANIPTRIAFTVASQIDSRTILDKMWAEDLLWKWDMLYYPIWINEPLRVQWVLVETHEVEAVVNKLKLTVDPDMLQNLQISEIVNWKSKLEWSILENYSWSQEEDPEIIEKAIQIVKESKKGSTSLIQRKLWLWYARAAKILDILEELWIVWPSNWSKPRDVYVD